MEATARTSAAPVDVMAIRIMNIIIISPLFPNRRCATIGGTKPAKLYRRLNLVHYTKFKC